MKCECYLFLLFCAIGLAYQVWLLAHEFTQSSLPLITRDSRDRDVLPAITVCFPLEYSVPKSEWLEYLAHILESSDYHEALKSANDSLKWKYSYYNHCKARLEMGKLENK